MRLLVCILFLSMFATVLHAQQKSSPREIYSLIKTLNEHHIQPIKIDDDFATKLSFDFLNEIDPYHYYLLKAEVNTLLTQSKKLPYELNNRNLVFIKNFFPIYQQALARTKKVLESIKSRPYKSILEQHYTPYFKDSLDFAINEKEITKRWEQFIKLNVILKDIQTAADTSRSKISLQDIFIKFVEKQIVALEYEIEHNTTPNSLYYSLAHCIPLLYDAHSNYFSYNDYQNFQSQISTTDYSFGITLNQDNLGQIEIVKIAPGSPAWKCNQINVGDIVTHLQWQDKTKIEVMDIELDDVMSLMDESNNLKLNFTLRSIAGIVKNVVLKKEKMMSDENEVKGYILQNESKKYGYISLPSFYTMWESETALGCANDVAKQLIRLKKNQIQGLIFDLRNNGGGSLKEGVELSGVFINEGPMMIQKEKDKLPEVLKDWNRGTAFSGPMVVLINGHSASASEIMASTLQDFNIAVIVGTDSYGKATGQTVMTVNSADNATTDDLKSGFAAVTMMKLYRVTGKSNQQIGVRPDIYLPDPYNNLYENESTQLHTFAADSINKKAYYQPLPALPINMLKAKSNTRISKSTKFQSLEKLSKATDQIYDVLSQPQPLTTASVKNYLSLHQKWVAEVNSNLISDKPVYEVLPSYISTEKNALTEEEKIINKYNNDKIRQDIYIEESFFILNDLTTK